jgi:hypothetical protein
VDGIEGHGDTLEELVKRLAWWERAPVKEVVLPIVSRDEAKSLLLDDALNLANHGFLCTNPTPVSLFHPMDPMDTKAHTMTGSMTETKIALTTAAERHWTRLLALFSDTLPSRSTEHHESGAH